MDNKPFGECLKDMRISAGKTVAEVSEYLTSLGYKASEKTIYSWESGRSQPTPDPFLTMCKFYGVTDVLSWFRDTPEIADVISLQEREHIKKYRLLDPYGKEAVDGVLDVESRRCEAARANALREQREQMEAGTMLEPDNVFYIINWFPLMPMSAGTGQTAGSDEPEELELKKRPPRGASYIAPVSGDSMEPTYQDGDKLFIRSCKNIEVGQVGVFLMDGQQWVKELGNGVLISHNDKYAPIPMRDDIECQGLVLGVCDDSYFECSTAGER